MIREYICKIPYSDNYASFAVGNVITINRVSVNDDGVAYVYPGYNHPIQLDAFKFCFEETSND